LNASFKEHRQFKNSKEVVTKNPVVCGREIRQTGLMAELKHKILIQINHYRL